MIFYVKNAIISMICKTSVARNIFKELNLPMFGILYSDITIWARDKDIKLEKTIDSLQNKFGDKIIGSANKRNINIKKKY